jgi:hypothetical protein
MLACGSTGVDGDGLLVDVSEHVYCGDDGSKSDARVHDTVCVTPVLSVHVYVHPAGG